MSVLHADIFFFFSKDKKQRKNKIKLNSSLVFFELLPAFQLKLCLGGGNSHVN